MSGPLRRATVFLALALAQLALLGALGLHAHTGQARAAATLGPCCAQVQAWRLTDLCLCTEARYTRHPAMADGHAAFQDHPTALEHFPSGSLMPAPRRAHVRIP